MYVYFVFALKGSHCMPAIFPLKISMCFISFLKLLIPIFDRSPPQLARIRSFKNDGKERLLC